MLNYNSKAMMIMNPNTRPSVPGTQNRGVAKNHLVKTQNFCKNLLKTKNQKKSLKVNIGTWNVTASNNEGNLEFFLNNMKPFDIKILGVVTIHWNNTVEDTFKQEGYAIIHSFS